MKRIMMYVMTMTTLILMVGCNSSNNENNDLVSDGKNNSKEIEKNDSEEIEKSDGNSSGFDVLEEIQNVGEFYRNSYVPNTLQDEVLSDSMKISMVDGEVVYEVFSNRLLKVEEKGDGIKTNAMSMVIDANGQIQDEEYFFNDGEEVAEGAYEMESGNILKWKKEDVYYALAGGRTKNTYSKEDGNTEIRPEDDRLEGYQDLVKVDSDFVKLNSMVKDISIPTKLPSGYKAVQVGYSYNPKRGYESYDSEVWVHYENEDEDMIYMNVYTGYEDMSQSEMRNENKTIEGVEVNMNSLSTIFIVGDAYYEIQHNKLDGDERETFITDLLK